MWDKIKYWLAERKRQRQEKQLNKQIESELAMMQFLGVNGYAVKDLHKIPLLLCSIYFEQDSEWIAVDFSREQEGIAHFMIFTEDTIDKYDASLALKKSITTCVRDAEVYIKHYMDGSEGWCFSC